MRTRSRVALTLAAAITSLAVFAAGASICPPGGPQRASAFGLAVRHAPRPQLHFPLAAQPEYGDGLEAGRDHEGIDLFAPAGAPELAVADGLVLEAADGDNGGRGNYVSIYSPARKRTFNYFHMLAAPLVDPGERVRAGQKLGELGCSGSCWGDHLHFELRQGRDAYGPVLDPLPFLRRLERIGGPGRRA